MFQLNPTLTHPLWTCRIGDSIGLEAYLDVDDVGLAVGLPTLCGQLMSWRVDWVPYLVFDRDEHEWNFWYYILQAYSEGFLGLELEDGGGRGTAGGSSISSYWSDLFTKLYIPCYRKLWQAACLTLLLIMISWQSFLLQFLDLGSHWEKRLLMNEIMTASVDTRSVVSAMTLALLEDSGWYQANFSMAEQLDWGRNQGIEFVRSRCSNWNGAYRCNSTHSSGCTYNREAEGYCPIVRYNGDLPPWAQYFPESNKGAKGSHSFLSWLHLLTWRVLLLTMNRITSILPCQAGKVFEVPDFNRSMQMRCCVHKDGPTFGLLRTSIIYLKIPGIVLSWSVISLWHSCTGGQSSLADFCAYFVAYSDGSCTDTSSARSPDRMLGEIRGEDSR